MQITNFSELNQFFMRAHRALMAGNSLLVSAVEINPDERIRSSEQNDYYWQFNTRLAEFFTLSGITYGYHKLPFTKDRIHEINKSVFDIATTANLSTKEFAEYMEQLRIFWNDRTKGFFEF